MAHSQGKVYLVGAGLGGLAYLTIQAQQLILQADVLVYDALIDEELLSLVPPHCQTIWAGKRGGQPSTSQEEINRLLVEQCQAGNQVIRLKSGDPFIFGRVSAEIQALQRAECEFAVIPGLSSALAAPLLAGIPLTDPVLSRSFTVLTAHEPDNLDWSILAGMETLVILMGGQNLPEIIHQLQKHDRAMDTPVAVIRWAGSSLRQGSATTQQQVWTGTLANIRSQLPPTISPAVIVIGEVVRLREYLRPEALADLASPDLSRDLSNKTLPKTDLSGKELSITQSITNLFSNDLPSNQLTATMNQPPLPLAGKTILVTRAANQASEFSELLQQQGAEILEMPTLEIIPPSSWQALDAAIEHLANFDWLLLTSANAVNYFCQRLLASSQDLRSLATIKIAVVGTKTAQSLEAWGIKPDFIPQEFIAEALLTNFPVALPGLKILFPRVETGGREILVREMTKAGAIVHEVAAYESRCPNQISPEVSLALTTDQIDIITFTSSKTVEYFWQILQQGGVISNMMEKIEYPTSKLLENTLIAAIGPQTAKSCKGILGKMDIEAQEYTLEGLAKAIITSQSR
ncbi:MAG: uroporphyrinogen-III C-methyltransferase [Coleofasciculaceae cyanobacterium SM2_1_6]|nr:uroporphyrinogen-III C-methyltransferase [Coleofasciculaceae cyanobacterium SM2_1_6]